MNTQVNYVHIHYCTVKVILFANCFVNKAAFPHSPADILYAADSVLKRSIFYQEGSVIIGPVEFGLDSNLVVWIDKNDGQISKESAYFSE